MKHWNTKLFRLRLPRQLNYELRSSTISRRIVSLITHQLRHLANVLLLLAQGPANRQHPSVSCREATRRELETKVCRKTLDVTLSFSKLHFLRIINLTHWVLFPCYLEEAVRSPRARAICYMLFRRSCAQSSCVDNMLCFCCLVLLSGASARRCWFKVHLRGGACFRSTCAVVLFYEHLRGGACFRSTCAVVLF